MLNGEIVRRIDDAIAAYERANRRLAELVNSDARTVTDPYWGREEAMVFGIWLRSTSFLAGSRNALTVRNIRPILASYERACESVINYARRGVPTAAQFILDGEMTTLFALLCEAMLEWRRECVRHPMSSKPSGRRVALAC